MKLTKLIKILKKQLSEKTVSILDRDYFDKCSDLYDILNRFDENTPIEKLLEEIEKNGSCPSVFNSRHECKSLEYDKSDCIECWRTFISKACAPNQLLRLHRLCNKNSPEIEEQIGLVTSDEYINWIYRFFDDSTKCLSSNDISDNNNDKKYYEALNIFSLYLNDLIAETDLENLAVYDNYEAERYFFKIKDRFFEYTSFYGQGGFVSIEKIPDDTQGPFFDFNSYRKEFE